MKLKRKLFSSMAFVLSLVMLAVSGAIFVHSAQQQTATSSLSVTFSGQNVNFEAQGWYHVDGGSRTAMVNNDDTNTGVSFSATDAPNTVRTLKISNTEAENKAVLTSEHPYVLFTYKFVNTASSGAFGMEVSLNITPTPTNLQTIKYASSTTLYTEADLDTFKASIADTATFADDFIVAGGTSGATSGNSVKYYYILLEVDDLTLPVTFNPSFNWSVECADTVQPATGYTVTLNITDGYDYLMYQTASFGTTAPTNIFLADGQSEAWTECTSDSVVIQNVQRIFITVRGDSLCIVDCTIGETKMKTDNGARYQNGNYVLYFDSGDLTGNVSYSVSISVQKTPPTGSGGSNN